MTTTFSIKYDGLMLDYDLSENELKQTVCQCLLVNSDKQIVSTNYCQFDQKNIKLEFQNLKSVKNFLIQLVIKNQENILGSISIPMKLLIDLFKKQEEKISIFQWFTLFDDQNDDIFDGEIQVDDEELPRAKFLFQIMKDGVNQLQIYENSLEDEIASINNKNITQIDEIKQIQVSNQEIKIKSKTNVISPVRQSILDHQKKILLFQTQSDDDESLKQQFNHKRVVTQYQMNYHSIIDYLFNIDVQQQSVQK